MKFLPSQAKAARNAARSHADPPGLWASSIITSVLIHLILGGMLFASQIGSQQEPQTRRKLIPVTAIPPNRDPKPTSLPEKTAATATTQPQTPSVASVPSSKAKNATAKPLKTKPPASPQPPRPARQNDVRTVRSVRPNPSPQPTPVPQPSPTPAPSPSPQPQQDSSPQPAPSPSPSIPPETTPSPAPSPSPQTVPPNDSSPEKSPSPSPPAPSSHPTPSSTGFTAQIVALQRAWSGDTVAQVARAKQTQQKLDSLNYLTPLDIELEGEVAIEAIAIVEKDGTLTVVKPEAIKVVQGSLPPEQAGQLAKKILEQWTFEPTYMAGQPIPQDYRIRVRLSPLFE